ncbi:MAG: MFS transporter, partial [Clostridiales Family XIII bacterium]|nr:MFS transporter [Clostridiales Family XIII bacterium]
MTIKRIRLFKAYLILIGAAPMLSTDLYLPALPAISDYYDTQDSITNMTMILFMATQAICSLLWGPISDRIGRRPVVITGGALYFAGSLLCMFSGNIELLVVSRVIQAAGGGAAVMAASAYVKDVFPEERREQVLSLVQGMSLFGPAVAPSIGALILRVSDWRGIFVLMVAMGAVMLLGAIVFPETLREPSGQSALRAFGRLWFVMKNRRFASVVLIFGIPAIGTMAFINASPYIFESHFGLSEQIYGIFFAASAVAMMAGAFAYAPLTARLSRTPVAVISLGVSAVSGICILLVGDVSPFVFIACILPTSFTCAMC